VALNPRHWENWRNDRKLEFGSAILAENGLIRIVSLTSSTLILTRCWSRNSKCPTGSRVEVELVPTFTPEP
jgi:hypothetical protein